MRHKMFPASLPLSCFNFFFPLRKQFSIVRYSKYPSNLSCVHHNGRILLKTTTCYDLCFLLQNFLHFILFLAVKLRVAFAEKCFSFPSSFYVIETCLKSKRAEWREKEASKNAFFITSALWHLGKLLFYQKNVITCRTFGARGASSRYYVSYSVL